MNVLARAAAVATIAAGSWLATAATPATADTPNQTGCPAGFSQLAVAELTPQGYRLPALLDNPANGGNGDGYVCGHAIQVNAAAQECGGPCPVPTLYNFYDNNRTPAFKS